MSNEIKIAFNLDADDWHGSSVETLWAKPLLAASEPLFEVQNTPFYSKDVSFLDVVRVKAEDGELVFDKIVVPSGHSTYRLLVESGADFDSLWSKLEEMGCTYESAKIDTRWLYAVDVPATTDIYAAYRLFQEGQKLGIWFFEEGHVGHKLKS